MSADAIIILGGGVTDDGQLPERPRARVDRGRELYTKQMARQLVMSGGVSGRAESRKPVSEALAMKHYAMSLHVPEDHIALEEQSKDTLGNAYFCTTEFIEPQGWKHIIIVTSDYHVPRTSFIFSKILGATCQFQVHGVETPLTEEQRHHTFHKERALQFLQQEALLGVDDGDSQAFGEFLCNEHPYYADDPPITLEQLHHIVGFFKHVSHAKQRVEHLLGLV